MRTLVVLCLAILASGCATRTAYQEVGERKDLMSKSGSVVGYEQALRDENGGDVRQLTLFVPLMNKRGQIIGYEERTRDGGATFRDLEGRKFGGRYVDGRSGKTLTIVVYSAATARMPFDLALARVNLELLDL